MQAIGATPAFSFSQPIFPHLRCGVVRFWTRTLLLARSRDSLECSTPKTPSSDQPQRLPGVLNPETPGVPISEHTTPQSPCSARPQRLLECPAQSSWKKVLQLPPAEFPWSAQRQRLPGVPNPDGQHSRVSPCPARVSLECPTLEIPCSALECPRDSLECPTPETLEC